MSDEIGTGAGKKDGAAKVADETDKTDEVKDGFSPAAAERRDSVIVKTSMIGIVGNVLLAAFKAAVGLATNSVAIMLDAVNNLSDALSSIITIVSTRLAHLAPNRKHPYGYGRIEYLATFIIAVLVMFAGFESLEQSVGRIIQPETPTYDVISLIIVVIAVIVKIALGRYFISQGRSVGSSSLVASGTDASMDSVISASTLVAALIFIVSGVSLEAWLGAVISVVIVKAGVDIIRGAISKLLGERVDSKLADKVRETVCSVGGVHGAYDLLVTDFGPERLVGSVHVEVDEDMTAGEFDAVTRTIQQRVIDKTGVILHTVGLYATNSRADNVAARMGRALREITANNKLVVQTHGLFVNEKKHVANFDVVVSYDAPNRKAVFQQIVAEMQRRFPDYRFHTVLDADLTD